MVLTFLLGILGTVLDGEMVLDHDPESGRKIPRYLIYDIICLYKDGKHQDVGNCDFKTRLSCIEKEIVNPRNQFIQEGRIQKESEPFRIRIKQFWDLSSTKTLLGPKFSKEQLGHEPDGLIFQPIHHVSVVAILRNYFLKDIFKNYFPDFILLTFF